MSGKWHGGKGSRRRPQRVSEDKVQENWDRIFKKKGKKTKE